MSPRNADVLDTNRFEVTRTQRIQEIVSHMNRTSKRPRPHLPHEALSEIRTSPVPKARARFLDGLNQLDDLLFVRRQLLGWLGDQQREESKDGRHDQSLRRIVNALGKSAE